ncbi:hypothetical protein KEM56_006984, partial [Ascosphaera pollenicola]
MAVAALVSYAPGNLIHGGLAHKVRRPRGNLQRQYLTHHSSSARTQSRRQVAYDEERTSDIFKTLITTLRKTEIDKEIKEKKSADWRAGNEHLAEYLERVASQHAFVPRIGELVLWAPDVHGEIRFNPKTATFQVFSRKRNTFVSEVPWRAGLVSQVPEDTVYMRQAFFDNTEGA